MFCIWKCNYRQTYSLSTNSWHSNSWYPWFNPDGAQLDAATHFSCSFPAWSLTLFTFAPAAPCLVILPPTPQPGGQWICQLQGEPGTRCYVQNSTNLGAWTTVSTQQLTGSTLNLTNPVPAQAAISFWRAVWQP